MVLSSDRGASIGRVTPRPPRAFGGARSGRRAERQAIAGSDTLKDPKTVADFLLTGSTGYIGAHVASNLLADHSDSLNVLVRARDADEARTRLWHALQLHMDAPRFEAVSRRAHPHFPR